MASMSIPTYLLFKFCQMCYLLSINFIFFAFFFLNGQSVSLNYNDVDIGRNVSALFHSKANKHQFYGGIKFHINNRVHDNQNNVFRKRFYASDFLEHIGLQLGYNYSLPVNERIRILFFYDVQLTSSGTKRESFLPVAYLGDTVLYNRRIIEFEEIKALEQNIGVGIRAELWDNIYFNAKFGGGVSFFWDIPFEFAPNQFYIGNKTDWEFSKFISVGIEYMFRKDE